VVEIISFGGAMGVNSGALEHDYIHGSVLSTEEAKTLI
jgi:hypothetical protein